MFRFEIIWGVRMTRICLWFRYEERGREEKEGFIRVYG